MTRRVFFDANVVIAGSMSRGGASRALLMLAEAGLFQAVISRQVLDEVERNLRLKLPEALPLMADLLGHIPLEIVDDPHPDRFGRWLAHIETKDAPILEAAVAAEVDYLMTLNSRDFTPAVAMATGLTIVTPGQFVARIREIVSMGLMRGMLPPRVHGLVIEWAALHRDDLLANWQLAKAQAPLQSIEPLE